MLLKCYGNKRYYQRGRSLFLGPIMQLLYHEANEQWSRVFTWLMPCFISGSIIYVMHLDYRVG